MQTIIIRLRTWYTMGRKNGANTLLEYKVKLHVLGSCYQSHSQFQTRASLALILWIEIKLNVV
jgi:hypothetical protein